jgi:hypothetical protein
MERHLWDVQECVRQGQTALSSQLAVGNFITDRNLILEKIARELGLSPGEILYLSGAEIVSEKSYRLAQMLTTYFEPSKRPN